MAQDQSVIFDANPNHLQIETKEDYPPQLAAIAEHQILSKYYLSSTEFEILREYINNLSDAFNAQKRNYKIVAGYTGDADITFGQPFTVTFDKNELAGEVTYVNDAIGRIKIIHPDIQPGCRIFVSGRGGFRANAGDIGIGFAWIYGFQTSDSTFNNAALNFVQFEIRVPIN